MEEYAIEFFGSSRYVVSQDHRELARKFVSGLSGHIRMLVTLLYCETLDRAIAATMSVESERELFTLERQCEGN